MAHGYAVGLVDRQSPRAKANGEITEGASEERCHGANGAARQTEFAVYTSSALVSVLPSVLAVSPG